MRPRSVACAPWDTNRRSLVPIIRASASPAESSSPVRIGEDLVERRSVAEPVQLPPGAGQVMPVQGGAQLDVVADREERSEADRIASPRHPIERARTVAAQGLCPEVVVRQAQVRL